MKFLLGFNDKNVRKFSSLLILDQDYLLLKKTITIRS